MATYMKPKQSNEIFYAKANIHAHKNIQDILNNNGILVTDKDIDIILKKLPSYFNQENVIQLSKTKSNNKGLQTMIIFILIVFSLVLIGLGICGYLFD